MGREQRAQAHAALGDERRLSIAEQLALGDRTVAELAELTGMSGSLLAHHLEVLADAGLVRRSVSEGDHRRRYVSLDWARIPSGLHLPPRSDQHVAFVCTHNSARSQFAAALWKQATGGEAVSAGSEPASRVHPTAVAVASEFGVDITDAKPGGYERIQGRPDLVVSVCDRALEDGLPAAEDYLHWSVPDPVKTGNVRSFRSAFEQIAERMALLTGQEESSG